MSKLPVIKPKELIQILEKLGWEIKRQRGSHIQLTNDLKPGFRITIPFHNNEIATGTLISILKQAGIAKEEFTKTARR